MDLGLVKCNHACNCYFQESPPSTAACRLAPAPHSLTSTGVCSATTTQASKGRIAIPFETSPTVENLKQHSLVVGNRDRIFRSHLIFQYFSVPSMKLAGSSRDHEMTGIARSLGGGCVTSAPFMLASHRPTPAPRYCRVLSRRAVWTESATVFIFTASRSVRPMCLARFIINYNGHDKINSLLKLSNN